MNNQLTRSGVAYNIEISPHKQILKYGELDVEYVFSSDRYKQIFLRKLEENRSKLNESLSKRYKFTIKNTNHLIADLKLYSMTEKRGFLINTKEESYRCLSTIKLDGMNLTSTN